MAARAGWQFQIKVWDLGFRVGGNDGSTFMPIIRTKKPYKAEVSLACSTWFST